MTQYNPQEKRTLGFWYIGLAFGAIAMGISLYSLYLYHRDLEEKYDSQNKALQSGR